MNRILLLTAALFACFSVQADLITQTEADNIVLERLSQETQPYIVYAKDGVQQKVTITSVNGEVFEVNYKFWLYYIRFADFGRYVFVKESNGNVLEVNVKGDATPNDLAQWRILKISSEECSVWKYTDQQGVIIELVFYPSENKVHVRSTPEDLGYPYLILGIMGGGNTTTEYRMENDIMYFPDHNGNFDSEFKGQYSWDIAYPSDNKMIMRYRGFLPAGGPIGFNIIEYHFFCQTNQTITPTLIAQGSLYGAGSEGIAKQNSVIKKQEEWNSLINKMNSVNNVSNSFTETDIDFSKYQIIALFDDVKGNGGWSIDITNITEYQDEIIITVDNLYKGGLTCVMTQPYHIVKIPVSDKKIVFKYAGEEIQYMETVLGGCNADEGLRSGGDESREDEVTLDVTKDSVRVFVGLNYICAAKFETKCIVHNGIIRMYVIDICEGAHECYARCPCYYTFDFQFERKGEKNYKYIVELISPLYGDRILSEGEIGN